VSTGTALETVQLSFDSLTRANDQENKALSTGMRDARYLRGQAELCLQIARETSDPKAAEQLRAEAARYHDQATEIEGMGPSTLLISAKEK
jgi:hypothetical protein